MRALLVLRPEQGAAITLARATAAGFQAVAAPLFTLMPVAWDAPDPAAHDALMLTSANAVRHSGPALALYHKLPVYAVGETTAAAAIATGFADVRTGPGDAAALMAQMAQDNVTHPLHLAGREHRDVVEAAIPITRRIVYAADAVATLPAAAQAALARGAIALIHSPRAAATVRALLDAAGIDPRTVSIAAISPAAAVGAWKQVAIAATPDDGALLAAAADLCEKG